MPEDLDRVKRLVEERTGYPVSVAPSSEIATHATMRSASKQMPVHVVLLNSTYEKSGNFLVAAQCAMLLIKWADRHRVSDFVVDQANARKLETQLTAKAQKLGVPVTVAGQFVRQILSGLLLQLTSVPMEIFAAEWCYRECPGLRAEQELEMVVNLRELSAVLNPTLRSKVPSEVYDRNVTMNAAYALSWAQLSGSEQATLPYLALGYLEKGRKLLESLNDIPSDAPDRYPRAVDSWGKILEMKGWYYWHHREG